MHRYIKEAGYSIDPEEQMTKLELKTPVHEQLP